MPAPILVAGVSPMLRRLFLITVTGLLELACLAAFLGFVGTICVVAGA